MPSWGPPLEPPKRGSRTHFPIFKPRSPGGLPEVDFRASSVSSRLGSQKYDKIRMSGRLVAQKYDKIRMSGRLGTLKYGKIRMSGSLVARNYDKIHRSGGFGTQKYSKIRGSGRLTDAGFWCLPGVPPLAAKKGLQNAFSYLQNTLSWRLARSGF